MISFPRTRLDELLMSINTKVIPNLDTIICLLSSYLAIGASGASADVISAIREASSPDKMGTVLRQLLP